MVATVEPAISSILVTVVTETLPEMETALKGPGFEAFQDERKVDGHVLAVLCQRQWDTTKPFVSWVNSIYQFWLRHIKWV